MCVCCRREEEERRKAEEAAAKAALTAEEEEELANAPPPVLPYSSMFLFSSTNSFRCAIHAVVTFPLFDVFIMIVIIMSSVALAAEDPVDSQSQWNQKLTYFDYGFTCVFGIEVLLKVSTNCTNNTLHMEYGTFKVSPVQLPHDGLYFNCF